jgi:hypothetical protein
MASLLTYGAAALATGLVGWWWFGKPAAYVPPGVKPGTPLSGVFVDQETAHDDWNTGAMDGAVRGYETGKTGAALADFRPETDTLIVPADVVAKNAYAAGYPCGARKGFALGARMRTIVGAAAAMGTSFDRDNPDSLAAVAAACRSAFLAWWKIHGAESVGPTPSVAGVTGHIARARNRLRVPPSSPHVAPTLGTTRLVTLAPPRRV